MTLGKVVALVLFIVVIACPLLIMVWWFLPIAAGICIWAYFKFVHNKTGGKFVKPVLLTVLLLFLIWLCFIPWKRHGMQPVEASRTNRVSYSLFGRTRDQANDILARNLSADRRAMMVAIETQRLALKTIHAGLDVNESAKDYVQRNSSSTDIFPLNSALTNLDDAFTKNGTPVPGSLLDPSTLDSYIEKAGKELDEIEQRALDPNATSDQLRRDRLGLASRLSPYKTQVLSEAVERVENALRQIFKTDIGSPVSVNTVSYDRKSDTLTAIQRITIDLGGHKASVIDVSGLVPEQANGKLSLTVAQDDHKAEDVNLADPRVPIEGARQVVITRLLAQPNASHPAADSRLWVAFREIDVQWPFPLTSSVKLVMASPDGSGGSWPYVMSVKSAEAATLQSIHLPRDSYYFSEDVTPPSQEVSDLIPLPSAPHLADLTWDKAIHVQLMPWYLSNKIFQHLKEYLALESIIASLIIATVTSGLLAIFTDK